MIKNNLKMILVDGMRIVGNYNEQSKCIEECIEVFSMINPAAGIVVSGIKIGDLEIKEGIKDKNIFNLDKDSPYTKTYFQIVGNINIPNIGLKSGLKSV